MTIELNNTEQKRCEEFKEVSVQFKFYNIYVFLQLIDNTQLDLLTIEEEQSKMFYTAYLNNIRALITIFDKLLPKTFFIMLPGDEIVEKKHANIKILTAQMESADLSKKLTRKWPGLGSNVFEVDYGSLFDEYKEFKNDEERNESSLSNPPPAATGGKGQPVVEDRGLNGVNQIVVEIEVKNTDHHKAIVKARNEYYNNFKTRF